MALAINGVTQRRTCCATLPLLPSLRTPNVKAVNKVKNVLIAKYHSPTAQKDIRHILKVAISIGISIVELIKNQTVFFFLLHHLNCQQLFFGVENKKLLVW